MMEDSGVLRPSVADGLKGPSAARRFEVLGEITGGDEGVEVGLQAVECLVMGRPARWRRRWSGHSRGLALAQGAVCLGNV